MKEPKRKKERGITPALPAVLFSLSVNYREDIFVLGPATLSAGTSVMFTPNVPAVTFTRAEPTLNTPTGSLKPMGRNSLTVMSTPINSGNGANSLLTRWTNSVNSMTVGSKKVEN